MTRNKLDVYTDASIAPSGKTGFGLYILFNGNLCCEEGLTALKDESHSEVAELHALQRAITKIYGKKDTSFKNTDISFFIDNSTVLNYFASGKKSSSLPTNNIEHCKAILKKLKSKDYANHITFKKVESSQNKAHTLAYNAAVNLKTVRSDNLDEAKLKSRTTSIPSIKVDEEISSKDTITSNENKNINPELSSYDSKALFDFIELLSTSLNKAHDNSHSLEKKIVEINTLLSFKDEEIKLLSSKLENISNELLNNKLELLSANKDLEYQIRNSSSIITNLEKELLEKSYRIQQLERELSFNNLATDTTYSYTSNHNNSTSKSESINKEVACTSETVMRAVPGRKRLSSIRKLLQRK